MNNQTYSEESYTNLSGFLSLERIDYSNFVNDPELPPTAEQSQNNVKFWEPIYNPLSEIEDDSCQHQNYQAQKNETGKKQRKNYSKTYRKRHREYVQNLEKMNQKYEKRIQQLSLKLEQMAGQIQRLKYGQKSNNYFIDDCFIKEKQETIKQLVNQAQVQRNSSWEKIREFADFYGFGGKQKINLLNYYMSQILENLLIDQSKFLVLIGKKDFQLTKPYMKTLHETQRELTGCGKTEINSLKKFLQKTFGQMVKQFHKSGQKFYESYVTLINQSQKIENQFIRVWDSLGKLLSPQKYIKVLKWYEQNKYCKEIQLLRQDWFQSFRNSQS